MIHRTVGSCHSEHTDLQGLDMTSGQTASSCSYRIVCMLPTLTSLCRLRSRYVRIRATSDIYICVYVQPLIYVRIRATSDIYELYICLSWHGCVCYHLVPATVPMMDEVQPRNCVIHVAQTGTIAGQHVHSMHVMHSAMLSRAAAKGVAMVVRI